ncbi:TPA: streptococcal pyrogenic exotoxin SpeM, partial [Streptococcus pyogenes]
MKKNTLTLLFLVCVSLALYTTESVFSDAVLVNSELKNIYTKDVINRTNMKITKKIGTQLIFNTNEKTRVWDDDNYNKVISSNVSPAQERRFKEEEVDIYALIKSYSVICKEQYNYVDGGLIRTSDREKLDSTIYMNIFGEQIPLKEQSKYKITFQNKFVTFQEIDVRLRKSLMSDNRIKLYEHNSICKKGYWGIHYKDNTTKFTDLFTHPNYTDNETIDMSKVSHFDIYLNEDF